MKQPELGKKIVALRKAKGLTQEELVEKCNLNVRTLQRIESGEVSPRSYTIKIIFAALDYTTSHTTEISQSRFNKAESTILKRLEQFYNYTLDLFNLKTNRMKKISILSVMLFAIVFGLVSISTNCNAQSSLNAKQVIEDSSKNVVKWFNNKDIDSLVNLYSDDACLLSRGCGKAFIRGYYESESMKYKFKEIKVSSISVCDSIAVEKGQWSIILDSGQEIGGEYITEWQFKNKKWLIVNDLAGLTQK
jgi:transcriptional regulator with XRE-family HTH domain